MRIAAPLCERVDNPVRMYPTPLVVISAILVYLQMAGVVLVNYVPVKPKVRPVGEFAVLFVLTGLG